MYIKQVIIEGFKSYKDQTITEPFSPKINCIGGCGPWLNANARGDERARLPPLPLPAVRRRRFRDAHAHPSQHISPTKHNSRRQRLGQVQLLPRCVISASYRASPPTALPAAVDAHAPPPHRFSPTTTTPPTAIRFVLNDIFHTMRAEERQSLLHVSPVID